MNRTALLALVTTAALLAGCSGDDGPSAEDFRAGGCRDVAAPVLAIGAIAQDLGRSAPSEEVRKELTTAQDRLRKTAPDPAVSALTTDLVAAVGLARLRADTRSWTEDAGARIRTAYAALLAACTATPPSPGASSSA